ncbi:helix-turn-helix domain-containing protein [Kurthia populi]|uniref:Helix-turn-helix domain-containing protein n=1 Tax=Kurthia populi TaxID=1562132 RepID=A0ABW5Y2R0_9BACL
MQEQGKSYQDLSNDTGISKSLIGHMLSGERVMKPERLIIIAKALGTEVNGLIQVNETNDPLEIVFRGELTNRQSKRTFEAVLFAIEDYVTMKQAD